jgi:hypothetical protein
MTASKDLEGNRDNSSAHLSGMVQVVAQHGGIHSFANNQAVLKLVSW